MRGRTGLVVCACLSAGCFNPDRGSSPSDTDTDTSTSESADASATGPSGSQSTSGPTSSSPTTNDPTSATETAESSGTTGGVPDWGQGEPPEFGDLGAAGVGSVNVVHALDFDGPVDVWLVGDASPAATNLARGDATLLTNVDRDARRVVLAEAGTLDAVACSDWFPLRADEQWAVVAARASHTCPSPSNDGGSVTFEQTLTLTDTPVRYVHAAAPDDLTVIRNGTPEPGTLSAFEHLAGADLPDCGSGCVVSYDIQEATIATREFSFQALQPADVPPPGEMLLVVLGDVRQEWPTEGDAMWLLRVDSDGTAVPIRRDPEVAPFAFNVGAVDFAVPAPPSQFIFATVDECTPPTPCVRLATTFTPGSLDFFASEAGLPQVMATHDLEGGHRYLLVYTNTVAGQDLALIDVDFGRADTTAAVGRGYNVLPDGSTLTIGQVFGGAASAIFSDIDGLEVTGDEDLPVDDWSMVYSAAGAPLGTDCFSSVDTPAGWRGLVGDVFTIDLPDWPPTETRLFLVCF